jgi:nucleotide-binding universal stress UspA family protein
MYHRILVPIDGSEISTCGLKEAIKVASGQGSALRLLHVANERVWACNNGEGTNGGDFIESTPEDGRRILGAAVSLARHLGIEAETVLVESTSGPAAPQIILQAKAWPADLIVMGTHGQRGLRRLVMGSDAETVVQNTALPVLLVHGEQA